MSPHERTEQQLHKIAREVANLKSENTENSDAWSDSDLIQDENQPVMPREGLEGRQQDGGHRVGSRDGVDANQIAEKKNWILLASRPLLMNNPNFGQKLQMVPQQNSEGKSNEGGRIVTRLSKEPS